ncbi:spermidine resistance protein [Coemansia sp. Benny D115]|nr:spermidine resistance protein [Coemansia sp. Benny D115]
MALLPSSSLTVGDAQNGVSVTGNSIIAEPKQPACTPTCSSNGTHSDGYTGAFEGPEKLLEMWFAPTAAQALCTVQENTAASLGAAEDLDEWTEKRTGLRCVPRAVWRDMLDLVHCQVLSTLSNEHLDSYLLSESSFFVYAHKLVLKTCGTTTLLYAIPRILDIARTYLGVAGAYQLFYSRKNFMFPDQQEELHRSWEKEVTYLDNHFAEGAAYMIGKTNRDHWHVYMSGPHPDVLSAIYHQQQQQGIDSGILADEESQIDTAVNNSVEGSPMLHAISRSSSRSTIHSIVDQQQPESPSSASLEDITVEILMTGLDPERMRVMYMGGASTEEGAQGGKAVERASGIADIYPESASDSYLFTPCGFSLNGLQGDGYYTIHVTPEPHCSYASFETNVSNDQRIDLRSPSGIRNLVEQVTGAFGPKYVTVTVFKARNASDECLGVDGGNNHVASGNSLTIESEGKSLGAGKNAQNQLVDVAPPAFAAVQGYKSVDRVLYEFDHYWLRYAYYTKTD